MNRQKVTVFLSSAGATNAVNVIKALRTSDLDVRIVAGDMDPHAAGLFMSDAGYVLPRADDEAFVPSVLEVCRDEKVDVALPIYSADFPVFERHKKEFKKAGVRTYAPSKKAWQIAGDKFETAKYMYLNDIPAPRTWTMEEALKEAAWLEYPLFMKLRNGSGSADTRTVHNRKGLEFFAHPRYVVQELLEGDEYTVDMISTLSGRVMAVSPRIRTRVRGGLSVQGITVDHAEIASYAVRIAEGLKLPGPSNVQCIYCKGVPAFYDINPRFASGGLPLAVAAGVNMPALLVKMLMGWKVPHRLTATPGIRMTRYWDTLIPTTQERP